jgi:hypothetical protein
LAAWLRSDLAWTSLSARRIGHNVWAATPERVDLPRFVVACSYFCREKVAAEPFDLTCEEGAMSRPQFSGAARTEAIGQPAVLRPPAWNDVRVDGSTWSRGVVNTRWLSADDDLSQVLKEVAAAAEPGDTIAVSEKIVVLLTGRSRDVRDMQPGLLARFLASRVQPIGNSCGLSIPEKMQDVIDTIGHPRIIAATILAGMTRPFGWRGVFFRVAGSYARDLDGMRPPYEGILLPPLPVPVANEIVQDLERTLGIGVAIVDINDRGGSVRATSPSAIDAETLRTVLADNPLGQRLTSTPVAVVRKVSGAPPAPDYGPNGRGQLAQFRRPKQAQR